MLTCAICQAEATESTVVCGGCGAPGVAATPEDRARWRSSRNNHPGLAQPGSAGPVPPVPAMIHPPTVPALAVSTPQPAIPVTIAAPKRSRPWRGSEVLALVVVVALVVAVGITVIPGAGGSKSHTLYGSVQVYDSDNELSDTGDYCSNEYGYDDISVGSPVQVSDENGQTIGAASLGSGEVRDGACAFDYVISDLPDAGFYNVSVGRRGELTYSRSELEEKNWELVSTLGL